MYFFQTPPVFYSIVCFFCVVYNCIRVKNRGYCAFFYDFLLKGLFVNLYGNGLCQWQR